MLNLVPRAPVDDLPLWLVQLSVELARSGRPMVTEDDLEPMFELMTRSEGVHFAVAVPRQSGIAVALALPASDAAAALDRARALLASCARYAGLGQITIRLVRVVPDTAASECPEE